MTANDTEQQPRLMFTIQEAADRLAVSRSTCYVLINNGQLATVRIGRLNRVPADELVDFVGRLRRGQDSLGG